MTTIHVKEKVDPICVGLEQGAALRELIHEVISRGDSALLDFTGVESISPPFLNVALGGLYADSNGEHLPDRLSWAGLDAIDEAIIYQVRESLARFWAATPQQQDALVRAAFHPGEDD